MTARGQPGSAPNGKATCSTTPAGAMLRCQPWSRQPPGRMRADCGGNINALSHLLTGEQLATDRLQMAGSRCCLIIPRYFNGLFH